MTPADILLSCYKTIKNFSSGGVVHLVYIDIQVTPLYTSPIKRELLIKKYQKPQS